MRQPIGDADYDYLARKMGFKDMKEVQAKRLEEEAAAEKARLEAEEAARQAEALRIVQAEDKEISDALRSRISIRIDNEAVADMKDHNSLLCPSCHEPLSFARDMLLMGVRRAAYDGEPPMAQWCRGQSRILCDAVPAGPDLLNVLPSSLLYAGRAKCDRCGRGMELEIEAACTLHGKAVGGPRKAARPAANIKNKE